jgi:hypothetical protein
MTTQDKSTQLSRRAFLAASGAAATGLATGTNALANTSAFDAVRIGSGKYTYELVPGWGAPPQGVEFKFGCGVVVDSKNRVYMHSNCQKCMIVYHQDGSVLKDWGTEWAEKGHGLYWSKEGKDEFLYFSVLGPYNQIVKTDLDGKVLLTIGNVKDESTTSIKFPFNMPTDVAIAPNGDIWVCEGYGGNMLHVFDKRGKFKQTIGKPGSGPGEFKTCHGIWVDTRGGEPTVLVADRSNARIQKFNLGGELKGELKGDHIRNPCCFYQHNEAMFVPDLDKLVTILDKDGALIQSMGDGRMKDDASTFKAPHALCLDGAGDLYVIEWVPDARLRKFKHVAA